MRKQKYYGKWIAISLLILLLVQIMTPFAYVNASFKASQNTETIFDVSNEQAVNKPSVDAIAVWVRRESSTSEDYEIWYSMYGHEPSIPARGEDLTWKWWNGTDSNVVASPLYIHGKNSHPDVAFGRAGEAFVVWSHMGGPEGPFKVMYAMWNSSNYEWSNGTVAEHNLPSPKILTGLDSPTVAVDVNGGAIAVWQANWYYQTDVTVRYGSDLYYSVWNGTTWSTPKCLYNAPVISNEEYYATDPELAFITYEVDESSSLTRHKAILVWSYTHYTFSAADELLYYEGKICYAIWNGSAFISQGEVPDSFSTTYTISAAELSSDKLGNTYVVWSHGVSDTFYVYSSKWNGSDWTTNLVCTHTNFAHRVRIAFNESNGGILVHDVATEGIYYSIGENNDWSTCTYLAQGDYPSIAYLAHDLTLTCWVNTTTVKYALFNGTSWSTPNEIPGVTGYLISEVAVAAKAGSPTLPLAEWTFLAYQQADNDLEIHIAVNDLNEMKSVGSTALINIVTLTDRDSTNVTNLYYVRKNKVAERAVDGWVPAELNLSHNETLEKFIKWVVEEYPASHYLLVLEDHGNGYRGSMAERDFNTTWTTVDKLTLDELNDALSNAGLENQKLDIIGFDACLMSMLEVAYVVKDYAEYFIASEQVIPLPGWPYDWILSNLTNKPLMAKHEIVKIIVEKYELYYDNRSRAYPETLAGIDLSRINDLVDAVNAFATELILNLDTYETRIINARLNAQEAYSEPYYIDLYDFANQIYNRITDTDIRNRAMNVMANINSTIIKRWNDNSSQAGEPWTRSDFYGLTIYFEKVLDSYDRDYNNTRFASDTLWDDFICAYLVPAIRRANIIIIRLRSLLPLLLHVYDAFGNHIGYNASLKPNIEIGIKNASYSELANNTIIIYFPIEVESFTWVVDAGTLTEEEHETNYTLTITVIKQGGIYFQETLSNTILYNTTHSGEFRVPYQLYVYVYGSVIENATVEVYSADGTLIQTGKTNATGWATFVLHEGEYYVRVNASGYEIFTTDVFYLNETKIISIELTPIAAPEQEEGPEAPPEVSPEKPIPTEIFLYGGLVTAVIVGVIIIILKKRKE